MSLESDARDAAMANSNVTALIDARFFHASNVPDETLPLVIYQQISSQGENSLGGIFVERTASYQWRLVSDNYNDILLLKAALKELAGTSQGTIALIDVSDGPDGFEFESSRYTKILNVRLTK